MSLGMIRRACRIAPGSWLIFRAGDAAGSPIPAAHAGRADS